MTACGSSWNTGSAPLLRNGRRGTGPPISGLFRENLKVALGKNFADFKALWYAFLHLSLGRGQDSGSGTRPIPPSLLLYMSSENNSPHCRSNRSTPQNPDISSILNLLICRLLTSVPWSCDWHLVEPGLQGLPHPLTEVAFRPTLSPRLLTVGGQTFHMPVSCQHHSSSCCYLGIKPPEQLTQGMRNICKEPSQRSHRKARHLAYQALCPGGECSGFVCRFGTVSLETENEQHREPLLPKCITYLLAHPGSGFTSNFDSPGLESTTQLCNENKVLRKENQRLQPQLSHISRGRRALLDPFPPWPHQTPIKEQREKVKRKELLRHSHSFFYSRKGYFLTIPNHGPSNS